MELDTRVERIKRWYFIVDTRRQLQLSGRFHLYVCVCQLQSIVSETEPARHNSLVA